MWGCTLLSSEYIEVYTLFQICNCGRHHCSFSAHIHTPTVVAVLYVMVPLSDHPVPLQVAAGLAEPWLGCDAEPTITKFYLAA